MERSSPLCVGYALTQSSQLCELHKITSFKAPYLPPHAAAPQWCWLVPAKTQLAELPLALDPGQNKIHGGSDYTEPQTPRFCNLG